MNLRGRAAERWAREARRLRAFLDTGVLVRREPVFQPRELTFPTYRISDRDMLRYKVQFGMAGLVDSPCGPGCKACAEVEETYFVDDTGEYGPTRPA